MSDKKKPSFGRQYSSRINSDNYGTKFGRRFDYIEEDNYYENYNKKTPFGKSSFNRKYNDNDYQKKLLIKKFHDELMQKKYNNNNICINLDEE